MKIQTSNIDLNSRSISLQMQRKVEFVRIKPIRSENSKIIVDVDYIYNKNENNKARIDSISKVTKTDELPEIDENLTPREQVAKFILEYIFGVKIQVNFYKILGKDKQKDNNNIQFQNKNFEIERIEFNERYEAESVDFSAVGTIKTMDGRSIEFSLNLKLNREFYSLISSTNSPSQDPLVFNFTNSNVELSKVKYQFDINADGSMEKISFPSPGSGFLVIDFNGNNIVDDGREVVGAISGDAIMELNKYDKDQNNWIDQQDDIFEKLKIWEKTITGRDLVSSLKDKNIGAIYLNLVQTPFQLKENDASLGDISHTGIFIMENGLVRPYHKINLNI